MRTIIDAMLAEKTEEGTALARHPKQAAHMANGLKLFDLKNEAEQLARVRLYRRWRVRGENVQAAYDRAIKGEEPLADMFAPTEDLPAIVAEIEAVRRLESHAPSPEAD